MTDETRPTYKPDIDFEKELFEAAVNLRGTVAPADYKHYVLPLLFLRYKQRRQELQRLIREPGTEYYVADARLATR
jgi:type I restriction enzyme M protein